MVSEPIVELVTILPMHRQALSEVRERLSTLIESANAGGQGVALEAQPATFATRIG